MHALTKTACVLLAAAAVTAAATALSASDPAPANPAAAVADAPAAIAAESAPAAPAEAAAMVVFPDGSERPTLNGVDETVQLRWPADTPYSPVVETVRDGDVEWFHHQDGSWSTTMRRLDTVSGNMVTLAPVFQPGPTKPQQLRQAR
ncbi:MAG: hypothetical protein AB7O97_23235 [Planctomycetota bacterium]